MSLLGLGGGVVTELKGLMEVASGRLFPFGSEGVQVVEEEGKGIEVT
jgi:L-asparaginase II